MHFPYSRTLAACTTMAIDPKKYVHRVCRIESVYKTYEPEWEPIKDEAWWLPTHPTTLVLNPHLRRHQGRPKSVRIRNEMDWIEPGPRQ